MPLCTAATAATVGAAFCGSIRERHSPQLHPHSARGRKRSETGSQAQIANPGADCCKTWLKANRETTAVNSSYSASFGTMSARRYRRTKDGASLTSDACYYPHLPPRPGKNATGYTSRLSSVTGLNLVNCDVDPLSDIIR